MTKFEVDRPKATKPDPELLKMCIFSFHFNLNYTKVNKVF